MKPLQTDDTKIRKRSRTALEKGEKKKKIVETALNLLFTDQGGELPSVDKIAKSSGVAKGTIYLYFNTKEEIFLHAMNIYYKNWFEKILENCEGKTELTGNSFAEIYARPALENEEFLKLASMSRIVFQRGLKDEIVIDHKTLVLGGMNSVADKISSLSGKDKKACEKLLMRCYATVLGCHYTAYPPRGANTTLSEEEKKILLTSFEEDLFYMLECLWDKFIGE